MITVITSWEQYWFTDSELGLEVEAQIWLQTCNAYAVDKLIFVPKLLTERLAYEEFDTVENAIKSLNENTTVVFLIPDFQNEIENIISLENFQHESEDICYVFANATTTNKNLINQYADSVVKIKTPKDVDMFGCGTIGIVLEDRKRNVS